MGVLCLVLVLLFSTLCPSSFAIISVEKRELIALLCLSSCGNLCSVAFLNGDVD